MTSTPAPEPALSGELNRFSSAEAPQGAPQGHPADSEPSIRRVWRCLHCHHEHPVADVCGHDDAPDNAAARVCMCDR
jgi:hypothetical protein